MQGLDIWGWNKNVALQNLSIYFNWEKKKSNKFKIIAPTCNDEFELPDGSYSMSNIQGCSIS